MRNKYTFDICKNFVLGFCDKYLESDISKLKDFCFIDLKNEDEIDEIKELNKKYCNNIIKEKIDNLKIYGSYFYYEKRKSYYKHNPNFEDCDDMNLIRAIYFILYQDKIPKNKVKDLWNSLYWVDDGNNTNINIYRGETINSFNTLITDNKLHKMFYPTYFKNNCELVKKITKFRRKLFTLGNFMILPNISINANHTTLNTYKGCCIGDYFDKFLNLIKNKNNDDINNLIEINKNLFDFNFKNFILNNYLENYVDIENNYNINFKLPEHFKYWEINENSKEKYIKFIEEYIEVVEDKINKRADILIKKLTEKLS